MFERDALTDTPARRAPTCSACGEKTGPAVSQLMRLQRTAGNAKVAALLQRQAEGEEESPVRDLMRSGGGRPLEDPTRQFMESRLGADFSGVRIHTGAKATEAARSVQAHAYTSGSDIVFQDGQYSPGTTGGQKMLAHELTHVVQQRSGPVDGTPAPGGLSISDPSDRFERAAEETAERAMAGVPLPTPTTNPDAPGVQGQEEEEMEMEMENVHTSEIQRQSDEEPEEEL